MDEQNLSRQFDAAPREKNLKWACKSCGQSYPSKSASIGDDHYHGKLNSQVSKLSKSISKYGHAQF